jgi:hypothetical protein
VSLSRGAEIGVLVGPLVEQFPSFGVRFARDRDEPLGRGEEDVVAIGRDRLEGLQPDGFRFHHSFPENACLQA